MSITSVGVAALIEELASEVGAESCAISFDADGTLWSGDVAEDVFGRAVREELLRADAEEPLRQVARAHGFSAEGSASALAGRLFDAYVAGRFPEREVCEVMTWCFAGFSLRELRELAADTLADLKGRSRWALSPLLDWARGAGVRVVIVSASPRPIVETGAALWGIGSEDIAAADARLDGERVLPALAGPIPYAAAKVERGRQLIGSARWLAAFGDSVFDLEMLRHAERAVAVAPKPALIEALASVPGARVLELPA